VHAEWPEKVVGEVLSERATDDAGDEDPRIPNEWW
jgi:hypothetical protein